MQILQVAVEFMMPKKDIKTSPISEKMEVICLMHQRFQVLIPKFKKKQRARARRNPKNLPRVASVGSAGSVAKALKMWTRV